MTSRSTQDDGPPDTRRKLGSVMREASAEELVSWLTRTEARARELAAAYLGDLLVHACQAHAETDGIVLPLVEALQREADPVVQEEIAHSLGYLVEYGTVSPGIVPSLRECLPRLHKEAAEYVTDIIECAD